MRLQSVFLYFKLAVVIYGIIKYKTEEALKKKIQKKKRVNLETQEFQIHFSLGLIYILFL